MAFVGLVACFHPLTAWQLDSGDIVFSERGSVRRKLQLPCGQCVGCRLERSRQWAVRCMHEAKCHEHSVFVTLTYDDDADAGYSLNYRHFQLFMKRLRKRFNGDVRFYMCGEYGERFGRPHFHACLFGVFFDDRELFRELPSGSRLYTSKVLSDIWRFGYATIGDVTFESAAYVARYCMKKVTGRNADKHYECVVADTGEIVQRVPEFNKMSLKPGIGALWYEKYGKAIYPRDYVVMNGVKMKPPRYYDKIASVEDVDKWCDVEYSRLERARATEDDATPERLEVREIVAKACLSTKMRSL